MSPRASSKAGPAYMMDPEPLSIKLTHQNITLLHQFIKKSLTFQNPFNSKLKNPSIPTKPRPCSPSVYPHHEQHCEHWPDHPNPLVLMKFQTASAIACGSSCGLDIWDVWAYCDAKARAVSLNRTFFNTVSHSPVHEISISWIALTEVCIIAFTNTLSTTAHIV